MYHHIMVPVDLHHADRLDKALATVADLADRYGAQVDLVSITAAAPGDVAHDPDEFADKLKEFAAEQGKKHGAEFGVRFEVTPDPAADLHGELLKAVRALGIDLVVMASHIPTLWDYLRASNAGHLASHADVSVFVVR